METVPASYFLVSIVFNVISSCAFMILLINRLNLKSQLDAFKELFNQLDVIHKLGTEARYLEAVYEFQRSILSQSLPPDQRSTISDQLSAFIHKRSKLFWDKAVSASEIDEDQRVYRRKSFSDYIALNDQYQTAKTTLQIKIDHVPHEFIDEYPTPYQKSKAV